MSEAPSNGYTMRAVGADSNDRSVDDQRSPTRVRTRAKRRAPGGSASATHHVRFVSPLSTTSRPPGRVPIDKTSASAKVSDADKTTAGAKKVWSYLNTAAKDISKYASSPLWKTVSGPYTVKSFATSGKVVLTPNKKYDGGEKANIATVNLLPFTKATAETNALRAGQVDPRR